MTTQQEQPVAVDIEAAIRAVPGVTAVFPVSAAVSRIAAAGARALGFRDEAASHVRLQRRPDATRVEAAIGVRADAGAANTCRSVHAAIDALCEARGLAPTEIYVTVVHVDEASS